MVKNPLVMQDKKERQVQSQDQENPLKEGMATHSSILAWRIPLTEEPGGLQSIGSQRIGKIERSEPASTQILTTSTFQKIPTETRYGGNMKALKFL